MLRMQETIPTGDAPTYRQAIRLITPIVGTATGGSIVVV